MIDMNFNTIWEPTTSIDKSVRCIPTDLDMIVAFDGHTIGGPNGSLDVENEDVREFSERKLFIES